MAKVLAPEPMLAERPLIDAELRQKMQRIVIKDGQECVALPASFAQQRLWLLDQLEPDSQLDKTALQ